MRTLVHAWLVCLLLGVGPVRAADEPASVEDLGGGRVRIGAVIVDREARSASLPAKVNMDDGYLEYVLVTEQGKTHESLLSTTAQPVDLHAAMLLLGVKGSPESRGEEAVETEKPTAINAEYLETARLPAGDPVSLTATWEEDGTPKSAAVEDWVINERKGGRARRGPWIYNGSEFYRGRFVAQGDGSFVSLITDPFALINNPREGYNNDLIWLPNAKAIPPVGTPVTVTIAAVPAGTTKKSDESASSQ